MRRIFSKASLAVDHVTIWRWVRRHAPVLNQRIRRELRRPNQSWRVDETYVKVAGHWAYLYRAVDSAGETIEFMLSPQLDLIAAKLFLRLALSGAELEQSYPCFRFQFVPLDSRGSGLEDAAHGYFDDFESHFPIKNLAVGNLLLESGEAQTNPGAVRHIDLLELDRSDRRMDISRTNSAP